MVVFACLVGGGGCVLLADVDGRDNEGGEGQNKSRVEVCDRSGRKLRGGGSVVNIYVDDDGEFVAKLAKTWLID